MTVARTDDLELALSLMWGLVLENDERWGAVAADFQRDDAEAIFSPGLPNKHFLTRGRGGSKTTDIAAVCLAWLATLAPARARGYVVAANGDQAAEVIDAAASLAFRTPELEGVCRCENQRILGPDDAWVRVMPLSESGAWGKRDAHLFVCDEFAQWPQTRAARRVWTAVRTTVQKTPGCRLVLLTSAGEPSHWSHKVLLGAMADPVSWRVHEVPGPVPWQDAAELDSLRRELLPSEYDRLILNVWTELEDRAIAPEDYDRACEQGFPWGSAPSGLTGGGVRLRHPTEGVRYVLTVDIGTRHDATVMTVAHTEPLTGDRHGPRRLVVDHLERWQGSRRHHVQLDPVVDRVVELGHEFNRAHVHADPNQFVGDLQRINRRGLRAEEFVFSSASTGQIANGLVMAFHNGQIQVPGSDSLREELLRVRLRESSPGVVRLDHDPSGHDDQAVTIGMACCLLLGRTWTAGTAFREFVKRDVDKQRALAAQDGPEIAAVRDRMLGKASRGRRGRAFERRGESVLPRRCEHRWRASAAGRQCLFCQRVEATGEFSGADP